MQWSEGDRVFTGQGWRLQVIAFLCGNEPAREDVSPNDTEATTSLVVAAPTKFKQIPPLLLAWLAVGAHAQRARLAHRRSRFALGDAGFSFRVQRLRLRAHHGALSIAPGPPPCALTPTRI